MILRKLCQHCQIFMRKFHAALEILNILFQGGECTLPLEVNAAIVLFAAVIA